MPKLDLHTHSIASSDGSLMLEHYRRMLSSGRLSHIAITDHNTIDFARAAQAELGEAIIIGEEIATAQGELIGLYLTKTIERGRSVLQTATDIHAQGGLVYVPHPFDTTRGSLGAAALDTMAEHIDIMEVHNGRGLLHGGSHQAGTWAIEHKLAMAASSDAHGWYGWGNTYSEVPTDPSPTTLPALLRPAAGLSTGYVGLRGLLYPSLNRLRSRAW